MQVKIVSHHVGGRGAGLDSIALPIKDAFQRDIINFMFDADKDSIAQTQSWWNSNTNVETHVMPFGIWSSDEEINFYLTYCPYASSVFRSNPKYSQYYLPMRYQDYVFGEVTEVMEQRRLPARSLDSLIREGVVVAPDFLSLDTQGSEFEILSGATNAIRGNVLAVVTELAFAEAYEGQKTFPAVHAKLLAEGFEMFELDVQSYAPARSQIGTRGKTVPLFGDALYIRRLDSLPPGDESDTFIRLCKLAAISAWFGHVEYSIDIIKHIKKSHSNELLEVISNQNYYKFIMEMYDAAEALNLGSPPTFNERVTFAQSKARFDPVPKVKYKAPARGRLARALRFDIHPIRKLQMLVRTRQLQDSESALENCFRRYGLNSIADLLKKQRVWYGVRT